MHTLTSSFYSMAQQINETPNRRIASVLKHVSPEEREKKLASAQRLVIRDKLNAEDLKGLFLLNTIDCLVVHNFCHPDVCADLTSYFLHHKDVTWYLNDEVEGREVDGDGETMYRSLGVKRVGPAFNTTYNDDEQRTAFKKYLQEKDVFMHDLRNFLGPRMSPIERVRLQLDELHANRCSVACVQGEKVFSGVCRITGADDSIPGEEPHIDAVPQGIHLKNQFAANVYLSMPEAGSGGELRMWNTQPFSLEDAPFFNDKLYQVGTSDYSSYEPVTGDLVLFCTRRPHAVGRFDKGARVSMQSFVGLTEDEDLVMWT